MTAASPGSTGCPGVGGAGVGLHLHAPGGQLFASVGLHGDADAQLLPENGVNHGPAQQQGLRQRRREQQASSAGFSQEGWACPRKTWIGRWCMDNDKADRKVVCGAGLGAELCRL
ncbi:hypothetical protein [Thiomonas sp.]